MDDLKLGHYLVIYLDVLGQSNKLQKFQSVNCQDAAQELQQVLKETVGWILRLRKLFKQQFESFESNLTNVKRITNESMTPRFMGFSDSFVVFVPLFNNQVELTPFVRIASALSATAIIMLFSFSSGHAIRGGIDVGLAVEIGPNEIYGAALEHAYI